MLQVGTCNLSGVLCFCLPKDCCWSKIEVHYAVLVVGQSCTWELRLVSFKKNIFLLALKSHFHHRLKRESPDSEHFHRLRSMASSFCPGQMHVWVNFMLTCSLYLQWFSLLSCRSVTGTQWVSTSKAHGTVPDKWPAFKKVTLIPLFSFVPVFLHFPCHFQICFPSLRSILFLLPCSVHLYCCLATQLCLTLCNPTRGCSPPGSSVYGILQARILEWVDMPSSRASSQPRDRTQVSHIAGRFFTIWATREATLKEEDKWDQSQRYKARAVTGSKSALEQNR